MRQYQAVPMRNFNGQCSNDAESYSIYCITIGLSTYKQLTINGRCSNAIDTGSTTTLIVSDRLAKR